MVTGTELIDQLGRHVEWDFSQQSVITLLGLSVARGGRLIIRTVRLESHRV